MAEQMLTIPMSYMEPISNDDGSNLDDLNRVEIYSADNDTLIASIPASSPGGGERMIEDVVITIPAGTKGQVLTREYYAVAVDDNGNVSRESEPFTLPIAVVAAAIEPPVCPDCPVCEECGECAPCPNVMMRITSECNCGINACRCIQSGQ